MFKEDSKYNLIHDNLNNQWLIVDISNENYSFYCVNHAKPTFEVFKPKVKQSNNFAKKIYILTALLITLSLFSNFRVTPNSEVYQKYYEPYQIGNATRSQKINVKSTLESAVQDINNKRFNSALEHIQRVIYQEPSNIAAHYFAAITYQELGKYEYAISEYKMVISNKYNLLIEQSQWYLGLCYIKTNDNEKAIKQFEIIEKNNGFYSSKAHEILRLIK